MFKFFKNIKARPLVGLLCLWSFGCATVSKKDWVPIDFSAKTVEQQVIYDLFSIQKVEDEDDVPFRRLGEPLSQREVDWLIGKGQISGLSFFGYLDLRARIN